MMCVRFIYLVASSGFQWNVPLLPSLLISSPYHPLSDLKPERRLLQHYWIETRKRQLSNADCRCLARANSWPFSSEDFS